MSSWSVSTMLFLQVAVLLLTCRAAGIVARRLRQPEAVGQMIAGIMLGPSLLGLLFPASQQWLFPAASKPILHVIAQAGLALYMFLVGIEFRLDLFRVKARTAAAISVAGMVVPFGVGMVIALWLADRPDMFPAGVAPLQGMLFLGAAMSITAFPMMARIISERGLSASSIGTLLLAAGAIDDAVAWCVIAAVLGLAGGGWTAGALALGGGVVFVALAMFLLRPLFGAVSGWSTIAESVPSRSFSIVLALLALSCWFTDAVGIHAVIGAFVVGVCVPRGALSAGLLRSLMPVVSVLLLPIYFVSSGLNTRLELLDSWAVWGITGVIILGACGGKMIACAAAARLSGEGKRESVAIGAMMNARGLMELVILNIGLERGLITPTLFTAGVLMAVVTTLIATPVFDAAYRAPIRRENTDPESGPDDSVSSPVVQVARQPTRQGAPDG